MKLFALDSSDHAELWELLDERFEYLPEDFENKREREILIDQFFQQEMCSDQIETPILIVFHISEFRFSNNQPFRITQEMYKSWPQNAAIFTLFVTGGLLNSAEKVIIDENLPRTHFHAYSLDQVNDNWNDNQRKCWQRFINVLSLTSQAQWSLLDSESNTTQDEHKLKLGKLIENADVQNENWQIEKAWLLGSANQMQSAKLLQYLDDFERNPNSENSSKLFVFIFGNDDGLPGVRLLE